MKKILFMLLIITVVACAPRMYECPDGTSVLDPNKCVDIAEDMLKDLQDDAMNMMDDMEDELETLPEVIEETSGEETASLDPMLEELQVKAAKNHNYKFTWAEYPENKATRTYSVRGDLVRMELYTPSLWQGTKYNVVYLDYAAKKAMAYCLDKDHCKEGLGFVQEVDFDDYGIKLPHEWLLEMTSGEALGGITIDSHAAERFKFERDGQWYQIIVQKYFGIPQRITWFDNEAMEGEPSGYEFRDMAFNLVKEADVTPSEGW